MIPPSCNIPRSTVDIVPANISRVLLVQVRMSTGGHGGSRKRLRVTTPKDVLEQAKPILVKADAAWGAARAVRMRS